MSDASEKETRETYVSPPVPFDFGAQELLGNPALDNVVTCLVAMGAVYAPRGVNGRLTRLGAFDVESRQEFTKGFRAMHTQRIRAAANEALERLLEREGIDPTAKVDMASLLQPIDGEESINISTQTWIANQRVTWQNLQHFFHANADQYLS